MQKAWDWAVIVVGVVCALSGTFASIVSLRAAMQAARYGSRAAVRQLRFRVVFHSIGIQMTQGRSLPQTGECGVSVVSHPLNGPVDSQRLFLLLPSGCCLCQQFRRIRCNYELARLNGYCWCFSHLLFATMQIQDKSMTSSSQSINVDGNLTIDLKKCWLKNMNTQFYGKSFTNL